MPLREGMDLEVSLEDAPIHGSLVMVHDEKGRHSVHRIERINNKLSLWPPMNKEPSLLNDVVMGPIIRV